MTAIPWLQDPDQGLQQAHTSGKNARLQRGADVKRMRSAGRRAISARTGCEGRHRALRSREDTHQGATPGFWPL